MSAVAEKSTEKTTLLKVKNLKKYFPIRGGILSRVVANVKAVEEVSFSVNRGEVVGLVGESGSGKTTAGRAILRLIEPTSGEVNFEGVDLTKISKGSHAGIPQTNANYFSRPFCQPKPTHDRW